MRAARTGSDHRAEHGGHRTRWLAVLGAAVAALGVLLGCQPGLRGDAGAHDGPSLSELPPYVVEPAVRLEVATPAAPRQHRDPAAGPPTRLIVPTLGIDAPVLGIGVVDGVLTPPGDPQTLGWWSDGAVPGALRGGALITGHTVHTGGGAMDDLETLRPGDAVRVRTVRGSIGYDVTAVTVYRKGRLARDAERVFSQDGPGRLVLITCEDWNGSGYDSNAIVFAERQHP